MIYCIGMTASFQLKEHIMFDYLDWKITFQAQHNYITSFSIAIYFVMGVVIVILYNNY